MVKPPAKPPTHQFFTVDDIVYFSLKGRAHGVNAMVSHDKWPTVSKYNWYLGKSGYPLCYELSKMPLHQFIYWHILGEKPTNFYIDHIDRNKLNNTNSNLRPSTPQENSFNRSPALKSNYKGVKKVADNNYTASITKDGKRHEIKGIQNKVQAAHIYNLMAEELHGEFAAKNEI